MSPVSSLKRMAAAAGLGLMVPIGYLLITGAVSPVDAGVRSLWLLAGVIFARKLAGLAPGGPEVVMVPMTDDEDDE